MNVLLLEGVSKSFIPGFLPRKKQILFDVGFAVEEGEVFGFLGPNGAGKTTVIKLIVGLIFADQGTVTVQGRPTTDFTSRAALGFLPENPYFYDYLTGFEFLDFYGRLLGLSSVERRIRCAELFDRLQLASAADVRLRRYSKGMLQRIGFAQALLGRPSVLILDEPMSGLDPIGRRLFRDLIREERDRGTTIFLSSHILQDAEMVCDRVGILVGGRMRSVGSLADLLQREAVGAYEVELDLTGDKGGGIGGVVTGDLVGQVQLMGCAQGRALLKASSLSTAERVIASSQERGLRLISMTPTRSTLEEVFLRAVNLSAAEGRQ